MAENLNQPKPDDAVLGGQSTAPATGAVLGGIEGVKQRLCRDSVEKRIAALSEALKYDEEGLNIVIKALKNSEGEVAIAAWNLLQNRTESRVQYALEEYIPLLSEVDMVYYKLRDLLKAHQWSDADRQTRNILLRISRREDKWLRREDIDKLPCTDLHTIDRLWTYFSKGHFGFSAQMRIWQEYVNDRTEISKFCDRIGWRANTDSTARGIRQYTIEKRDDVPANLNAPRGHFPTVFAFGGGKTVEEAYTTDTESTMGFYSIDGYRTVWSFDSFFGIEMVLYFLKRFQACQG